MQTQWLIPYPDSTPSSHVRIHTFSLLRRLLLQIRLHAPLPRLPIVMPLLRLILLCLTTREPCDRAAECAAHTIRDALAQVGQLALSLLALALLVLADALLLEALRAHEVAERLLRRTDRLVPRTGGAVGVVLCDAARRAHCEGAGFGGSVGEVVLGVGRGFFAVGFALQGAMLVGVFFSLRKGGRGSVWQQRCRGGWWGAVRMEAGGDGAQEHERPVHQAGPDG